MWKGVIIEESLTDKLLLALVRVVQSKKTALEEEEEKGVFTLHSIELDDSKLDEFVKTAQQSIKNSYYLHICKDNEMIVVFKDKVFNLSSNDLTKINEARDYGISIGILKEQMPFEKLIENPFD